MSIFSKLKKAIEKNMIESKDNKAKTKSIPIFIQLEDNLQFVEDIMGSPPDLIIKKLTISNTKTIAICFLDGLVDEGFLHQGVIAPLVENKEIDSTTLGEMEQLIQIPNVERIKELNLTVKKLLKGNGILFIDGHEEAVILGLSAWEMRSIEEPNAEANIRGPREGFTESVGVNLSMLRRKIINPNLRFEQLSIGATTNTSVLIVYLEGLVSPKLLKEVKRRLKNINHENILESGYVEQFIEDDPQSIFPTIGNTEKPDKMAGLILDGRIGIIVDGTPTSLTIPYLFIEGFQSAEDYYSRQYYTSLIRLIRFLSFALSINFPAFYVATQNFHKEMIPTTLLASIAAAREGVPFPLIMELVIMLIVFEILREAGVRMPQAIGQAMSIVGALILGDAAVQAGVVGTPTIIIIGITGITSFVVTPFSDASAILRFLFIVPAGIIGLYGLLLANLALLIHLSSLKSFGIPYFSPVSPAIFHNWRDVFIKLHPQYLSKTRAKSIPIQPTGKYKFEPEEEEV